MVGGVEVIRRNSSSACLEVFVFAKIRRKWVLAVASLIPSGRAASARLSPGMSPFKRRYSPSVRP
jgi:hypothetical protein